MPSRKITVQLVGDSDSLERAFSRSEQKGKSFGNSMGSSAASLKGLAKAGAVGAAVGGIALLTKGLISSVSAAKEAQVAETNLRQALKQSGNSFRRYGKEIDSAITKTSKLSGIDDEELSVSFANLVRSTGSVTKAQKGMNLAANIARARSISLASATKMVEKAYKGSDSALKRVGIVVPKVSNAYDTLKQQEKDLTEQLDGATAAEKKAIEAKIETIKQSYEAAKASDKQASAQSAIAEAQKKFAGSAQAYGKTAAGAQERLSVAWENLQEKLGAKLLPVLTKVMLRLVDFIEWGEKNWPKFSKAVSDMWEKIRPVFEAFRSYIEGWVKIIQGIIEGDWSLVWAGLKKVVVNAFKLVYEWLKLVPLNIAKFGLKIGAALADAIIEGMGNLAERMIEKIPGAKFLFGEGEFEKQLNLPKAKQRAATPPTTQIGGRRQHGGPALARRSYLIGEKGAELLTMGRTSGFVTPMNAGGGAITVVAPIYLDGREIGRSVTHHQQRASKSVGSQTRGGFGGNPVAAFG